MGLRWIEAINYLLRFHVHQKLQGQIRYADCPKINPAVSSGLILHSEL
jgi:hypothetical protein